VRERKIAGICSKETGDVVGGLGSFSMLLKVFGLGVRLIYC
jgi:hypothetical protein